MLLPREQVIKDVTGQSIIIALLYTTELSHTSFERSEAISRIPTIISPATIDKADLQPHIFLQTIPQTAPEMAIDTRQSAGINLSGSAAFVRKYENIIRQIKRAIPPQIAGKTTPLYGDVDAAALFARVFDTVLFFDIIKTPRKDVITSYSGRFLLMRKIYFSSDSSLFTGVALKVDFFSPLSSAFFSTEPIADLRNLILTLSLPVSITT